MFKPDKSEWAAETRGAALARPRPGKDRFRAMNSQPHRPVVTHQVLQDKQSEPDHRQLRIDKVGVRNLRFPIQVRDKAYAVQNTVATIGMFVDLPKEFKGTHMSRFIEVLNAHGHVVHV